MKSFTAVACATLCVVASGCRQEGTAPESFRVVSWHDFNFEQVVLRWYPPSRGDLTGYELSWRAPGGAGGVLASVDAASTETWVVLGLEVPDATELELRLRALPDPDDSRVATALLRRGPRPPLLECASTTTWCAATEAGVALRIENRSPGASKLVLTRSRIVPGTPGRVPGPSWDLPVDTTSYFDSLADDWSEEAEYVYTLAAVNGGERSFAVRVDTRPLPLLAPVALAVTPVAGGMQVSFEARSPGAQCYEIARFTPDWNGFRVLTSCLAPPAPGGTGTYLDPAAPGFYEYRVVARSRISSSAPLQAWFIPSPPPGLTSRLVSVPPGTAVVRLASGAFATADERSRTLFAPGEHAPVPLRVGAPWPGSPLIVGPDGQLQAFVAELPQSPASPGETILVHARYDGATWSTVEIGRGADVTALAMGAGLDGMLRAAWVDGADLFVATRGPYWGGEKLAGVARVNSSFVDVAAGVDGVVHVLHAGATEGLVHRFRSAAGWQAEAVPGSGWSSLRLFAGAGPLRLLGRSSSSSVSLLERSAAGWGAPELIADGIATAGSGDGSVLVVAGTASLWVRDATGTRVLERTRSGASAIATGVGPGGKAWILEYLRSDTPTESTAVLYEEE